ncbi:hypothetical protein D910_08999 [Dendroctonus ponderosae]|uniref:Orange domain-containing protein n=1 Tax=Dendroctonus ponderosae TaxID=77166 RepID=U4UND8_DENPD|nr:hypothetical protein D910_08999 [Dendroctonus ponderosae]
MENHRNPIHNFADFVLCIAAMNEIDTNQGSIAFRLGYQEAMSEAMRFMVEVEGHFPGDPMCMRLLHHLQKHCDQISKAPATFPTSPIPEQVLPFPVQVPSLLKNGVNANSQAKVSDYAVPKAEPENSNSNDAHPSAFRTQKADEFEKDLGHGGVSYKYKTNIKLRFTQDLGAHDVPKRQKLDDTRRNSFTSFENQRYGLFSNTS